MRTHRRHRGASWVLALYLLQSLCGCGGAAPTGQHAHPGDASAGQPLLIVTDRRLGAAGAEADEVAAYRAATRRWSFSLPSPGTALAAAGEMVYVGTDMSVYALSAQTGQMRWQASVNAQVRSIQVIGGQVYVDTGGGFTGQERLEVYALDGRLLWRYIPPDEQDIPAWLVDGGTFYSEVGGETASLVARDAATGTLRWQTPLQIESPLLALLPAGPTALLVVTQESLVLVQRSDGTEVWRRDQTLAVGPQIVGQSVVAFCVDQPTTPGGTPSAFLRALQLSDGRLLWEQPLARLDAGFLSSGQPLTVGAITPEGAYLLDSPDFSTLHAWNLDDGQLRWTSPSDERWQGLAAAPAQVYLTSQVQLLALQADTGEVRWRAANPDHLTQLGEAAGLLLGVNPLSSVLAAYNPTNGQRLFRLQVQTLAQYMVL